MKKSYNTTYPCDPASHCEKATAHTTRHSEPALAGEESAAFRHSEPALAGEESTNGKVCVNSQMDTSCEFMDSSLSTKAQNDGVEAYNDKVDTHNDNKKGVK